MKTLMATLTVVAFLLVICEVASACTCAGSKSPTDELKESKAVFSGKVLHLRRVKPAEKESGQVANWFADVEVVFEIQRSWKHVNKRLISVFTSSQSSACGYGFRKGRTYLVYAGEFTGDKLATSICSRTRRLKDAQDDLKELGAGKIFETRNQRMYLSPKP